MNILIIGGTRFIGPHVARRLIAAGHRVTIFHRGKTNDDVPTEAAYIHGDRRRLVEFAELVGEAAPEVVIDVSP